MFLDISADYFVERESELKKDAKESKESEEQSVENLDMDFEKSFEGIGKQV
jgi:hypothetical protein